MTPSKIITPALAGLAVILSGGAVLQSRPSKPALPVEAPAVTSTTAPRQQQAAPSRLSRRPSAPLKAARMMVTKPLKGAKKDAAPTTLLLQTVVWVSNGDVHFQGQTVDAQGQQVGAWAVNQIPRNGYGMTPISQGGSLYDNRSGKLLDQPTALLAQAASAAAVIAAALPGAVADGLEYQDDGVVEVRAHAGDVNLIARLEAGGPTYLDRDGNVLGQEPALRTAVDALAAAVMSEISTLEQAGKLPVQSTTP